MMFISGEQGNKANMKLILSGAFMHERRHPKTLSSEFLGFNFNVCDDTTSVAVRIYWTVDYLCPYWRREILELWKLRFDGLGGKISNYSTIGMDDNGSMDNELA